MPKKQSNDEDKLLIETLLVRLNAMMDWSYKTDYYPDVVNRKSKDIDLIAKSIGLPDLAFEETRVSSFEDQVGFEEKFKRLYMGELQALQKTIKPGITCCLPHNIFKVDEGDYSITSQSIFSYLIENQDNFHIGSQTIKPPDLNLEIKIIVSKNPVKKFIFKIYLDESDMATSLKRALNHKKDKLRWYSSHAQLATLLISNYDTQNISVVCVYQAFLKLAKQGMASHLHYVFYHDISEDWFCFKGDQQLMDKLNPAKLQEIQV